MAWIQIKPAHGGGGRRSGPPGGKLYEAGQFVITHATVEMLGDPEKVLVEIEPDLQRIRLMPTTPDHQGAFSLAGGGNAQHRIGFGSVVRKHPQMVGDYPIVVKVAGGVELRKR